ncbi:MAG: DEAD/DEAH box helicase, partial [Propionibacteriaceae bacterium]|nr:DEAD/DEAH box helicase [Propionibacteriaceae bacterium]
MFSESTRAWFSESFAAPTPVQTLAWEQIGAGKDALVIAPTGSGKTLAAFLWAIDSLFHGPPGGQSSDSKSESDGESGWGTGVSNRGSVRVLYVSPLKALGVDVERNLRQPLSGIVGKGVELGLALPSVRVGVRSGDTPPDERRRLLTHPPDILITTPESLFLMLSSSAAQTLTGVETVIVDEIHSLAGTKRGAHLMLSLERMDALADTRPLRIGLSATVRPPEAVARFLGGTTREVVVVDAGARKSWDIQVRVPVDDMTQLPSAPRAGPGESGGEPLVLGDSGGHAQSRRISPCQTDTATEPVLREVAVGSMPMGTGPWESGQAAQAGGGLQEGDVASPILPARNSVGGEQGGKHPQGADVASPGLVSRKPTRAEQTGMRSSGQADWRTDKALAKAMSTPQDKPRPQAPSLWPHIEAEVYDLIRTHSSTICFCNSRGVAERLTAHLNTLHREATGESEPIARTHHGSVAKGIRADIEAALKAGTLPCVVATNSLELGIDMGAVDLVIQVASPPSVASGLQRVGRGGHQVGATSNGVFFPLSRADLLTCSVVVDRMVAGEIEHVHRLLNPLDVLAQHIVSMCIDASPTVDEMYEVVRRCDSFADLPRAGFDSVLDMLAGAYPSDDFAELRARVVVDHRAGVVTARPGARRLVTTSGGTIPDRGLYPVYVRSDSGPTSGKHAVPRRVGELDEEMVYESRIGDHFTLGTSTWTIEEMTTNHVIVSPAPGVTGRVPFWHGDDQSRPAELGRAIEDRIGVLAGEVAARSLPSENELEGGFAARLSLSEDVVDGESDGGCSGSGLLGEARLNTLDLGGTQGQSAPGEGESPVSGLLDPRAERNLVTYIQDQRRATGVLPDRRTIVVERGRDEMGAWRLMIQCPLGKAVLRPWSLLIVRNLRAAGVEDVRTLVSDDGIVIRLGEQDRLPDFSSILTSSPQAMEELSDEVLATPMFAAHFRQCAARALLLPRRDPGKRSALWQQRLRSSQLLSVVAQHSDFPIVVEALREIMDDAFDRAGLEELLTGIASRRIRLVEVETREPSPFAASLLFGYTGAFLYDPDQPLAERLNAASMVDPSLLASLLGDTQPVGEETFAEVEAEIQRLVPSRKAKSAEQLWDLLRVLGPLTEKECELRCASEEVGPRDGAATDSSDNAPPPDDLPGWGSAAWLESLIDAGRVVRLDVDGQDMVVVAGDETMPSTVEGRKRLVARWVRGHGLVSVGQITDRYGWAALGVRTALEDLVSAREAQRWGDRYVGTQILARARKRWLGELRASVKPVSPRRFASFLLRWNELDRPGQGMEALMGAVESLAGYPVPYSMLESVILPARVRDYTPSLLDEALSSGEVRWTGHGRISDTDGWVCLWPGDMPILLAGQGPPLGDPTVDPYRDPVPSHGEPLTDPDRHSAHGRRIQQASGDSESSNLRSAPVLRHGAPPGVKENSRIGMAARGVDNQHVPGEPLTNHGVAVGDREESSLPTVPKDAESTDLASRVWERLSQGGAWGVDDFPNDPPGQVSQVLWDLAWEGLATSDSMVPLRALSRGEGVLRRPHVPQHRIMARRPRVVRSSPGRWLAVPQEDRPDTRRLFDAVSVELNRYG